MRSRNKLIIAAASLLSLALLSAGEPAAPSAVAAPAPDGLAVEEKTIADAQAVVERGLVAVQALKDYSCVFVKHEVVNGVPQEEQYIFMKVRREPFSAYLYFLLPDSRKGQEAIYVAGQRDGKFIAHGTGWQKRLGGNMELQPTSDLAMKGNRHPITEAGMENLLRIVSALPQTEPDFAHCRVRFFPNRLVAGRTCLGVEYAHPQETPGATFLALRIYFDSETALPLRQEMWLRNADGKPEMVEEYTYADVKTNRGYKDRDFDPQNPAYDYN